MFVKLFFLFLLINTAFGLNQLYFAEVGTTNPECDLPLEDRSDPEIDCRVTIFYSAQNATYQGMFDDTIDDAIYNRTNIDDADTLAGDLGNPLNASGLGADIFTEQSDIDAFEVWNFVKFFDGGFVLETIERSAFALGVKDPNDPTQIDPFFATFIIAMEGVFGLLFALFIFFVVTGRSFSSFT